MILQESYSDWYHNAGDIMFNSKTEMHYLLLEKIPTDLSSWTALEMESGEVYTIYGIGKTEYQRDTYWFKIA